MKQQNNKHIGYHKVFHPNETLESSVCKYFEECSVAKETGRPCNFPAYLRCQTYKFRERYKN